MVMISVVFWPTGQLVTVGAQLVMVYTFVILVILVSGGTLTAVEEEEEGVGVTGQTVVYKGIVSVTT